MSKELKSAVQSLTKELESIMKRASEIKKTINQLSVINGEEPPYKDIEVDISLGTGTIRPDQFFGKGLSTAVKDFIKMKGSAATAEEIFEALNKGGFEYPKDWKDQHKLKNLAISLSKNRHDFVYVNTGTIKAFGLWEFYPEKKREKEKEKLKKIVEDDETD